MSIKRRVKRTTHYISAYTLKHAFILPNVGFPVEQRSPRLLNINEFRLNNSEDGLKPENRYDSKYFEYIEGLKKQGLVQGFMPTVNSHQESIIPSQKRPQYPKKLDKCIPIPEFKSLNNEYLKKLGDYLLHSCKDNHSSLVVNLLENLDINSNLSQLQLYPFKVYLKYHDLDEISEQLSKIPQLEKYYLRRILQTKNDALIYKNISRLTADKDCWLGVLEWMIARKRFFEKQTELVSKLLHKGGCKRLVGLVIEYLHSSNSDWTAVAQTCTKFGFTPIVQQTIMKLVDASGNLN